MAKKPNPADFIEVYIKREARSITSQVFTYAIKDFGQAKAKKDPDRYATKFSAKRSALRKLGAWDENFNTWTSPSPISEGPAVMRNGKVRRIVFINRK